MERLYTHRMRTPSRTALKTAVAGAAVALAACAAPVSTDTTSGTDSPADLPTTSTTSTTTITTTPQTATDTTGDAEPTRDVGSLIWRRIAHDEQVFGGPESQAMNRVTAFEGGLVAVGRDMSGGDQDAAVWWSDDGTTWTRVAHDEQVFGGPDVQAMSSVVAFDGGLVAVGIDGPFREEYAAVWLARFEG